MKKLIFNMILVSFLGAASLPAPDVFAALSAHPLQTYEKGLELLYQYRGQHQDLEKAQGLFERIIAKHPDSPFGYLGLSQAKLWQAYQYEDRYNIKIIEDEAMPLAYKALRAAPPMRAVHEHFDRCERILMRHDEIQDLVRRQLLVHPDEPKTYFDLGNYVYDQADYQKAVEYFKIALRLADADQYKFKVLRRIAWVLLNDLHDPLSAIDYYQAALAIRENTPGIWEDLGRAYLDLNKYQLSAPHLVKAMRFFNTPDIQSRYYQAQGMLYEQRGEILAAIESMRNALRTNNQNTSLHYQLGNLYYQLNDFHNAYVQFRAVIEAGAPDPQVVYFAGRSAESIGEHAVAREYYQKYLQLRTDGQEAEWIRKNIPDLSHR